MKEWTIGRTVSRRHLIDKCYQKNSVVWLRLMMVVAKWHRLRVTVTNLWKKLIKQKFTHIHCKDSVLSSRCRTYYSRNLNARCLRPEHLVVHSGHYETAKEEEETENEYLNPCTMQTPKLKVEKHPVK
ncbi:hypothetical protein EYC84_008968 [Monilinia fructicola]|uniref:Uncharacterized protein n=1 Tax=Monilinia fructicola TaxID=38448 RepID=A0A5M9J9Z5_MONFR|nr:hypothetical protein EYC84_008968 [Monilinia fructicola]